MNNMLRLSIERKVLPVVQKPMRYMGGELNCVKKELLKVNLHGVFCFPDLYDIGMSHFGLQILYHIINKRDNWALSRAFQPWTDAEAVLRENSIPLYTLEYFTPVKEADWVGFTIQYELQYTNVLNMLDLSGITLFQDKRSESEPIIIAGGPCVSNPEPLSLYIDAFAIGDGENTIVAVCEILEKMKNNGASRKQKLDALSNIPGIYIPSLCESKQEKKFIIPDMNVQIRAAKVNQLENSNYPSKPIVPLMDVIHNRLSIEVMRGCTRGCRFCSAGTYYRPVRERDPQQILESIQTGVSETGWKEVGLLSLSTADYTCLSSLLTLSSEIKKSYHLSLSLPSTRIDALTEEQLKLLNSVSPVSSMTIAPEAGSIRLRKVINKDFSDEEIISTVDKLLANNIQTLKIYFMIGLPTETMQDIDAIISLVNTIAGKVRAVSKRRSVNVSISPFSPKPHTPFEREQMEKPEILLEKGRYIKYSLKNLKNVKVSYRNPEITYLETVMARGDKDVGVLLYNAWKNGAKFDGWDECFDFRRWITTAEKKQIEIAKYIQLIEDSQVLPWKMISTGVSQKFLFEERNRALQKISTPDCRISQCSACGVCGNSLQPVLRKEKIISVNTLAKPLHENKDKPINEHRYRIYYEKGELMRFLGHLDMSAIINRSFQMGRIPLAFSQGYNPHPKVSFGPPLPLGVAGKNEALDIVTTEPVSIDLQLLNKWLPYGLSLNSIITLHEKECSLNASIKAARYHFTALDRYPDVDSKDLFEKVMKNEILEYEYEKNGQHIKKNLRDGIIDLKIVNKNSFEAVLALQDGITCKPSELIKVLFNNFSLNDFLAYRMECFSRKMNNLQSI